MSERAVDVSLMIGDAEHRAGRLWSHRRRGVESATFRYDEDFLANPLAYPLDPALPLVSGSHQTPVGRSLFGAFTDLAPDRWGRRLIARSERARVKVEGGGPRSFGEIDYLLGVRDDLRQGAVRFREVDTNEPLATPPGGVPPLVELPRLLAAADRLGRDEPEPDDLVLLMRGGSSLGGARPKAHVITASGHVGIAKFPSPSTDAWDVIRWEAVALTLARHAGITVPDAVLEDVAGRSVLVVTRFDRAGARRRGYCSAMTMLEATDGDQRSYLEIADVIAQHSGRATADLRELWRRIAFSIAISNTDDHLRNHGFLRSGSSGWLLAPAFDMNPSPDGGGELSTTIDFTDPSASVDLLRSVAPEFRLTAAGGEAILGEVATAVAGWRRVAAEHGFRPADISAMELAFAVW